VIGSCRPTQSTRNWRLLPDIFDCDGARRRSVASEERRAEDPRACRGGAGGRVDVSIRPGRKRSKSHQRARPTAKKATVSAVAGMTLPTEFLLGVVCC
jgi:hypothetical protein